MDIKIPKEMYNIALYFRTMFDFEPYSLKTMMERAAAKANKQQKKIISTFIDDWLSKNYTDDQMSEIWNRLDSGIYIEKKGGVKYFLAEFRKYLV